MLLHKKISSYELGTLCSRFTLRSNPFSIIHVNIFRTNLAKLDMGQALIEQIVDVLVHQSVIHMSSFFAAANNA